MIHPENEIQEDYISRINKVFQFIDQNPDGDLFLTTENNTFVSSKILKTGRR